jgi:hypothetical protein
MRHFERFGGFLNTFSEKWRLFNISARLLKNLRDFFKTFSDKWRLNLEN